MKVYGKVEMADSGVTNRSTALGHEVCFIHFTPRKRVLGDEAG